jgi:hypothetical protein
VFREAYLEISNYSTAIMDNESDLWGSADPVTFEGHVGIETRFTESFLV